MQGALDVRTTASGGQWPTRNSQGVYKITDGLFISGIEGAKEVNTLMQQGVTHVLNLAGPSIYEHPLAGGREASYFPNNFVYKILETEDSQRQDLKQYFPETTRFIHQGRQAGGVLVHCFAGVSRSATIILAYLMEAANLDLATSFKLLARGRPQAYPNRNFQMQLVAYEDERSKGVATSTGQPGGIQDVQEQLHQAQLNQARGAAPGSAQSRGAAVQMPVLQGVSAQGSNLGAAFGPSSRLVPAGVPEAGLPPTSPRMASLQPGTMPHFAGMPNPQGMPPMATGMPPMPGFPGAQPAAGGARSEGLAAAAPFLQPQPQLQQHQPTHQELAGPIALLSDLLHNLSQVDAPATAAGAGRGRPDPTTDLPFPAAFPSVIPQASAGLPAAAASAAAGPFKLGGLGGVPRMGALEAIAAMGGFGIQVGEQGPLASTASPQAASVQMGSGGGMTGYGGEGVARRWGVREEAGAMGLLSPAQEKALQSLSPAVVGVRHRIFA